MLQWFNSGKESNSARIQLEVFVLARWLGNARDEDYNNKLLEKVIMQIGR